MGLDYCIDNSKLWLKGNFSPYGSNVYIIRKESGFSPNGAKVFDFYEPFDTLNGTIWTTTSGTPEISNGELFISNTSTEGVSSVRTFSYGQYGVYAEILAHRTDVYPIALGLLSSDSAQGAYWYIQGNTADAVITKNTSATTTINDIQRTTNTFYVYGVGWTQSAVKFFVDYNLRQTSTTNLPTLNKLSIALIGFANAHVYITYLRVRKLIDTEPTVTVIDEGAQYKVIVKNNMDKWLNNYQFAINLTNIGVSSQTESLNVIPLTNASDMYSDLFNGCTLFTNIPVQTECIGTNRFGAHNGYLFDGTYGFYWSDSDHTKCDLSGDFTIFLIYNRTGTTSFEHLCSRRGEADLRGFVCYLSTNIPIFYIDGGDSSYTVTSSHSYTGNVYYGATRKSAEMQLYINGSSEGSTTVSTNNLNNSGYFRVGVNYLGNDNHFTGQIDCVAVWNRALSAAEHKLLYDVFHLKDINPYTNTATTVNTQQKGY